MKLRIVLALLVGSSAAIGCFQTIDNGVIGGPPDPNSTATSSGGAVPIGTLVDAGLPDAFAGVNLEQQCEAGSALCFQLCGSPECATSEGGVINGPVVLPAVLQTPAVILPDGGQSTNPCDQLEADSIRIRQNGCAQCHSTVGAKAVWTWVMDDNQLFTNANASGYTTPLAIAGNPSGSAIMQKMELGLNANPAGMPPSPEQALGLTSPDAAATIVYPTAEDFSIMYAWILACGPGGSAGAAAYETNYGGGNYGPEGGSTTSVKASADGGH